MLVKGAHVSLYKENKYSFAMECACEDPSHMLIVEVHPEGPNDKKFNVFVYLSGNFRAPWYLRIVQALFFIIKPNPYMFGNVVQLNEKNTQKIINLGKSLEEILAIHAQKEEPS